MKFSRNRRCYKALASGLIVALSLPFAAAAQDAGRIIAKVKTRLEKIESLSCSFEREHAWKAMDRTQNIAGKLQLKKPYKLRVEYPAQTIVVDGKSAWTYVPRNKQVTITNFKQSDAEYPTPQSIFRRYSGRKAAVTGQESVAGRSTDKLHLIPSAPMETDVTVWIDRELNFPVKSVETTANGDVTTSILTDVVINGKIADSVFTFKVPDGARVVDMRK
ncbi:MAG: outer membrane lipoprotein chaperone LolA [Candidatus Latescibacterota bacterium]